MPTFSATGAICLESPDSTSSGNSLFSFQSGGSARLTTKAQFANQTGSRVEQLERRRASVSPEPPQEHRAGYRFVIQDSAILS